MSEARSGRPQPLGLGGMVTYSLPSLPIGFMAFLVSIYLLKFSTDVLLLAPATMGILFGLSRFWDAVSDPLCGYWTDRTRTRFGRRRPWIALGTLPVVGAFMMLWGPPSLEAPALTFWMAAAILLFYTGLTMVDVPHSALGAELTDDYHARTRLFGVRRIVWGLGSLFAVAGIAAFDRLPDPRVTGGSVGIVAAALALPLVFWMVARTRERPDFQGRGARNPFHAFRDVWRNRHARTLLLVFLIQQLGVTTLTVCMPFYSTYVLKTPDQTFAYIGAMLLSSVLGVPLWMRFGSRFEKKQALMWAMALIALVMASLLVTGEGDFWLVVGIASLAGLAVSGTDVLFPSLQADAIDWDELQTGERKEGAYFAAWAFAAKTAGALGATLVGLVLGAMDFVPNAEQAPEVVLGLRLMAGLGPGVLYAVGIVLFARFALDRAEHARILEALGRRPAGALGEAQPSSTLEASVTSSGTRAPSASKRASEV
jgi:GPH family glycoside/pentoside/hexuronide:cation symporter